MGKGINCEKCPKIPDRTTADILPLQVREKKLHIVRIMNRRGRGGESWQFEEPRASSPTERFDLWRATPRRNTIAFDRTQQWQTFHTKEENPMKYSGHGREFAVFLSTLQRRSKKSALPRTLAPGRRVVVFPTAARHPRWFYTPPCCVV